MSKSPAMAMTCGYRIIVPGSVLSTECAVIPVQAVEYRIMQHSSVY